MTTITRRVTGDLTENSTKRITLAGATFGSPWGDSWGDNWGTSWQIILASASINSTTTKRVGSGPTANHTKRVTL